MVDSMLLRVHRAKLLTRLYDHVEADKHASTLSAQDAIGILAVLKGVLKKLEWPAEDLRLLSGETQLLIVKIDNCIGGVGQMIELAQRAELENDWTLYFERHQTIREICGDISDHCDVAQPAILGELGYP